MRELFVENGNETGRKKTGHFFAWMLLWLGISGLLLYRIDRLEKQIYSESEKGESIQAVLRNENGFHPVSTEVESDDTGKGKKRVYLTFDDGPSIYTDEILDILDRNGVKATFFVIGREEEFYDAYRRIVREGHSIGLHSYTHDYQKFYASEDAFGEELTRLNDLLCELTGTRTNLFRFPGGSSNRVAPLPIETYIAYLNEHGINYYDWNALNGDAVTYGLSPEQLVRNIMHDVSKNEDSIVLMHDLKTTHATVESLQPLIDTLKQQGYEILPIDANTPLIQHVSCNSLEE